MGPACPKRENEGFRVAGPRVRRGQKPAAGKNWCENLGREQRVKLLWLVHPGGPVCPRAPCTQAGDALD